MTKKELHAALDLHNKIQRLQGRLKDLGYVNCKVPEVRVQGGCAVSAGQQAAEIADEISELEKQLHDEQVIIQRYIDRCQLDDTEKKVMELHFVCCYPWHSDKDEVYTVSNRLNYSKSRLHQIYQAVLQKIGLG